MPKKPAQEPQEEQPAKEPIKSVLSGMRVITEDSNDARELYNHSRFGALLDTKLQLSLIEAFYLIEKSRLIVLDGRNRPMPADSFLKKASRLEPKFWVRYSVFKDLRNRGYIVKTALKFGADFRVYDRGVKPGEDHAKWIVYPVHEAEGLTWYEFSAKNRVAHSTKKRILIAVVDDEQDVSFWEVKWVRP